MLEKSKVSNRDETAGGSGATSSNNPHARGWSTTEYPLRAFLPQRFPSEEHNLGCTGVQ